MPYIPESERNLVEPLTAGQLNYKITMLINDYLKSGVNYTRLNEVIGVLECAKLEIYRRVVAPYEEKKVVENGDVFDSPTTA